MKYPQVVPMPSAVQNWLEEQLEARGIDSAIYSRYILSLLYHDQPDISDLPSKPKEVNKRGYGRKRGRREDAWDLEQLKRSAAVECLKSACDQNCGLEALVDELCLKLKEEVRSEGDLPVVNTSISSESIHNSPPPSSNQDSALKYYAAFPPLNNKVSKYIENSAWSLSRPSAWSGKRVLGSSFGKNRTFSEGNNKEIKLSSESNWLEENKENQSYKKDGITKLRSRSTVKQHISEKVRRNMAKSLDRKDDDSFRFLRMRSDVGKNRRLYQLSSEVASNPNLAKLVSCSIKSIWTPEKAPENVFEDEDHHMDFYQQLLESPDSPNISQTSGHQQTAFIQCGTNITSSIWSEKIDLSMDCSLGTEGVSDLETGLPLTFGSGSIWSNKPKESNCDGGAKSSHIWCNGGECCFQVCGWNNKDVTDAMKKFSFAEKWSVVANTDIGEEENSFSINSSLNTLNHNKEDSSFTQVIPRTFSSVSNIVKDTNIVIPTFIQSPIVKKEEEDLLTSKRTHFRPIKHETASIPIPSTSNGLFPDGTTFPITGSLDQLSFHRTASGTMFLESDYNTKYMEYKNVEDEMQSEFVPKFKMSQNNKFCQTDDFSKVVGSVPFSSKIPPERADSEMYFPGDESLMQEMRRNDNRRGLEDTPALPDWGESFVKIGSWPSDWTGYSESEIWSNNNAGNQWRQFWNDGKNNKVTQEGKELLSNQSCIQNNAGNENQWRQFWNDGKDNEVTQGGKELFSKQSYIQNPELLLLSPNPGDNNQWRKFWDDGKDNVVGGDHVLHLRNEVTQEGEELLSNLSCIQNLILSHGYMDQKGRAQVQQTRAPLVEPACIQWHQLPSASFTHILSQQTSHSVRQS
uniref:Uncharacterized protein n=1 Tax=Clastoptera arizonana TaxID=38151 RepID=A0A1B6C707_9HEMI